MLVFETLKNKKSDFLNSNMCFCLRLYSNFNRWTHPGLLVWDFIRCNGHVSFSPSNLNSKSEFFSYLSLFQLQMLTLVTVDINAGINVAWEDFPHWMEDFGATLWIHGIIVLLSIMVSFCTYIFKELSNWTTNMHQPC